ncbi:MAG: T9SS type A sorting domain-containing protein [Bacteroidota bacterium]
MKNLHPILFIILQVLLAQSTNAQWTIAYQDVNAVFTDGAFPTDHTGYVTGGDTGGTVVFRTNDGGVTWNKRYIAGWNSISKIAMTDSMHGYLMKGGVPVQILRTGDGFNTYTTHSFDSSFSVQALELLNDSTGFYLNNATRLRKFKHYGANYSYVIDTLFDGQNLQFVNSHTGYLDNGYRLIQTTDTGLTWNYINQNLGFYCTLFRFADSLNGYFSDAGIIYITHDGGLSFPQQYIFPATSFTVNGNFCMAANSNGDVVYTTDGGINWQPETTGINVIVPETYIVKTPPGGNCFLFSNFCGEIRKRQEVINDVEEPIVNSVISIYPNPFTSSTTISFREYREHTKISVTDILGNEISSKIFTGIEFSLSRGEMREGIYFISILDERNDCVNRKIVIQ